MKTKYSALAIAIISATAGYAQADNFSNNVKTDLYNIKSDLGVYSRYQPISWFRPVSNSGTRITDHTRTTNEGTIRTVTETRNGVTTQTIYKTVNGVTTITKIVDGVVVSGPDMNPPTTEPVTPPEDGNAPVTEPPAVEPVPEPEPVADGTNPENGNAPEVEPPTTEPVTEPVTDVTNPENGNAPEVEPPTTEPVTEPVTDVTNPENGDGPEVEPPTTEPVTEPVTDVTNPGNENGPTTEPPVVEPEKPVVEPIADDTPISPSYPIVIKPTQPSSPTSPIEARNVPRTGVVWNDISRGYDPEDPNNKANVELKGEGVTVAVVDSGFNNPTVARDIQNKFGYRGTILNTGRYAPADATHGIQVAEMVGGNTANGVAPRANLLLADITRVNSDGSSGLLATADIYNQLWNRGARIFNQSYGIPKQVTYFNDNPRSAYYYGHQFNQDLLDFYTDAVDKGGLFVWAAGNNRGERESSPQAALPYFETQLEKGWLSVVALAARDNGRLGDFSWSNLLPYSQAGLAKNWTVSAMGDYVFNVKGSNYIASGSSFAAPAVTGTAALVKQKYPWMDGNLIKQSILTTATDIGARGVDDVYGWGLLDVEKAVKGPARFDSRITLGEDVNVTIPQGSYAFENDISGDVGLVKNGQGELVLTGASSFTGDTTLNEGAITINGKSYGSAVNVGRNGTLVANSTVLSNGVSNDGVVVNNGNTVIENGYAASANGTLVSSLDSKLSVKGGVDLNNSTLVLTAEKDGQAQYVTAKGVTTEAITSDSEIKGEFGVVETTTGLLNATVNKTAENVVAATLSRQNVETFVANSEARDAMTESVASNLESSFSALDRQIDANNAENSTAFAQDAALLQNSLAAVSAGQTAVLDSLSGQIYASAQALTFQNAETVNKDLTNRLTMLGTLNNADNTAGVWVSGIYGNGKLKENGFGEGKTKTYAGQIGFDKLVSDNFILGTAVNYSTADVSFNRYGGKSDAKGVGVSLYGRWSDKNAPWYLQGRVGYGWVDSDVERTIILDSNNSSTAKINHKDKVISGYLETGYDFKQGNFTFTPYIGVSHDVVKRGAFSETNSQFGLTADKATYQQTSGLAGVRMSQAINFDSGVKTTLQGYVNHQTAFNNEDLSFDASYTGLQNADFRVKGIGLAKNKTWVGVGALTEFTPNTAWYLNYDLKLEHGKGKNNVLSTGVRISF
ncbi:autotransporter domain-containing protein [Actinobacillus equuli]|uniref:autotransporter domain-containing protein n=1 Tax=Actinobacillus equuli TaxID=718 RepID=UPI0024424DFE|nr:autotransporter domain-containing protein [Actinobacillus equuli]WGE45955.1 autotransporter domain-containing protein [Actinobacillus equuli subsp. haemolyticus]